jgi:hypothetical protein
MRYWLGYHSSVLKLNNEGKMLQKFVLFLSTFLFVNTRKRGKSLTIILDNKSLQPLQILGSIVVFIALAGL